MKGNARKSAAILCKGIPPTTSVSGTLKRGCNLFGVFDTRLYSTELSDYGAKLKEFEEHRRGQLLIKHDVLNSGPLIGLASLLDKIRSPQAPAQSHFQATDTKYLFTPGEPIVPMNQHLLYFCPYDSSTLASDGYELFSQPPEPFTQRMWGGANVVWHKDLHVGEVVSREESLLKTKYSLGSKGALVLVIIQHNIFGQDGQLALTEERNFIYRKDKLEIPTTSSPSPQQPQQAQLQQLQQGILFTGKADWEDVVYPDAMALFQYSALTYNSHLIHYNEHYTRNVEGYPDLLVHGPLTSTLLLDHFWRKKGDNNTRNTTKLLRFNYRAMHPLFNNQPIRLSAEEAKDKSSLPPGVSACKLWASNPQGAIAMAGTLHYTV